MLNVTLAQINPTVGAMEKNAEKIVSICKEVSEISHIIVFPELSVSGYPPEDLLLRIDFLRKCKETINFILQETKDLENLIVFGTPYYEDHLYNALIVAYKGEILGIYKKSKLPNYGVFDEERYFKKGNEPLLISLNGVKIGFSICEDIWYPDGTDREAVLQGAEVIININASPYEMNKQKFREGFIKARAEDNQCFVVYVNLVGGQDELVFDGRSMIFDPLGNLVARCKAFEEDTLTVTLETEIVRRRRLLDLRWRNASRDKNNEIRNIELPEKPFIKGEVKESPEREEEIYNALVLGTGDYVKKNGFKKVVIGLSGGIDSSLVACIATDALGSENVMGVFMPTRFSSKESFEDARELAKNLGIEFRAISIDDIFESYLREFKETFGELKFNVADENIQARIRANILFYISNKFGYLVLSTSNKSESAVGYTTIYGDMAGGFAPIKDVYKTLVYRLAEYRNSLSEVIPERVFKKPPSAELRPNQTDQDTLPPYEILDRILWMYIEENMSPEEIVKKGFDEDTVKKVIRMVKSAEYKRKQAPIGIKITPRAFGKDWRMPVVNKFLY